MTTQLQLLNPQLQSLPFPPPRVDMQTGQINLADWNDFLLRLAAVTGNSASFSSGTGVNEIPQNYSQFNAGSLPPMSGTATRAYDTGWTLFGLASLKVTGSGTTYFGASTGSFPFALAPSQKWIISVYTKATVSQAAVVLGITTAAGSYTVNLQTHAVAGDVLRIYGSLDLTADSSSAFNVYIQTSSGATDAVWFDGFMLEPQSGTTGTPSPYSLNTPSTILNTNPPGGVVNNLPYANHGTAIQDVVSSGGGVNVNPAGGVINQLPHPNQSAQVLQVIANNSGNGQLNVSPTGGVTSQLPHANHSPQVLNVITNNSGNGQLNVSPTGGVISTLPYANHAPSVKTTIVNTPDGNGSYLGHGTVFQPHIHSNQIGWGHFIGDTSGNYSGNLVDGLNLRFLHGAMSGAVQTTVQGSADTNGSYLTHGVVFQPHISANQIGFGHFKGDTSGNYTGNLVDAGNLRFLHGAMSTGVQGVISSGSQVNVNPAGGVTGNLPYSNHDISVRNTLTSTAGGDGSYLNVGQVFNRHLNQATQSGLADDANAKMFRYGTLASRPAAGTVGRIYHAQDAGTNGVTYRDTGTAWIEMAVGHLADINGTTDNLVAGSTTNVVNQTNLTGGNVDLAKSVAGKVLTNISDDGTYSKTLASVQTGNVPDLGKGILGKFKSNLTGLISDNLVANGDFLEGTLGWALNGSWAVNSTPFPGGSKYLTTTTSAALQNWGSIQIPIDFNATYLIRMWVNCSTTSALHYLGFREQDANGNYVEHTTGVSGTYAYCLAAGVGYGAWTELQIEIGGNGGDSPSYTQFNTNAVTFSPFFWVNNNGLANVIVDVGAIYISKVGAGARRGIQSTTPGVGNYKAFADFTNNAAGGHVGKTQSNIDDDSNAKMLRFGTLAGRPAAGTAGRIYHASDAGTNGITYRDTGSAWVGMAVGHLADISGTLDNTNDGSSRFAVAAVDPNKKALIDFSQPGHSNADIQYFGGIQSGTCYDGQAITFNPAYASIPLVIFSGGGMSYSSVTGSATTQSQAFIASSLTTSGFTASLKLVSGGTLTARSDNFTTVTSGSEYQATLTNAPAYNNTYTVNWTLSLNSSSSGTVYIRETNGSGTILFQKNYLNGQNGAKSTSVTWSGATGTSVIDISLVLTEGTGTISASTVTFTSGTAPSSVSAVPSTAPITWVAFPQT